MIKLEGFVKSVPLHDMFTIDAGGITIEVWHTEGKIVSTGDLVTLQGTLSLVYELRGDSPSVHFDGEIIHGGATHETQV